MSKALSLGFLVSAAACLLTALLLLPIGCSKSARNQHQPASATEAAPKSSVARKYLRAPAAGTEPSGAPAAHPAEKDRLAEARVPGHEAAASSSDQQASSPTDDELIEKDLAKLKKGNLAYNTPERMKTGTSARITARIGSDRISLPALESGMPAGQGTRTETEATPVSARMKMTLKGADFEITPLSSEEQIVGGDLPTEWEWDVVPKHAGTLRLHLAAIVELKNLSRDYATVDKEIAVQVDLVDAVSKFAAANAVWILGTLGAGVTGLWAWWKRRRKSKAPDGPTP
jgi:hypothetical protein